MKHLFCISSPFQADSAKRVIEHFELPVEETTILLFDHAYQRDRSRVQLSLGWVYNSATIKNIDYKTNSLSRRMSFIRKEAPTNDSFLVYTGDWRNKLAKFFALHPRFKGFRNLDDGTIAFALAERAQKRYVLYKLVRRLSPNFISRYPIQELCPDLDVIQLPSARTQETSYSDKILFIGCSAVEKDILSEKSYQKILQKAADKFPDKHWFYYPHRSEIEKHLPPAFEYVSPEQPIELWYSSLSHPPGVLVSLFSSALINLKSDYPDSTAYYIKPETEEFLSRHEDIDQVYNFMAKVSDYKSL